MNKQIETGQIIPNLDTFKVQDPTKLKCYIMCARDYFFRYVLGLHSEYRNHHLDFGIAWHRLQEQLLLLGYNETGMVAAYAAFEDYYRQYYSEETDMDYHPKSPANAYLGLLEYVKEYHNKDNFETLYTEVAISVPIGVDRVIYGKMDHIGQSKLGIFSLEHKTGSKQFSWWDNQWTNSIQVLTYTHFLCSWFDPDKVVGLIVNGSFFYEASVKHHRVKCLKNVVHLEGWLWEVNQLYDRLEADFSRLDKATADDIYLKAFQRNTESCIRYMKPCSYFDICHAWENPLQHMESLPVGMKVEHWDPRKEEHIKHHFAVE